MNNEDAKELHELLFSFTGLFHEKFLMRFRHRDHNLPGLKKNHFKIMGLLSQHDFLMSSEIGRRLDIEKGSITTLIDQLVEKGLVARQIDPCDRRKSQVSLSAAGREKMNSLLELHAGEIEKCLQDMKASEINQFLDYMRFAVGFMNKI